MTNKQQLANLSSGKFFSMRCQWRTTSIRLLLLTFVFSALTSCAQKQVHYAKPISTTGHWILEQDGSNMLDPQTSGLSVDNGYLFSVSDGSAHASQIQRLHKLDPATGAIIERFGPIQLSPSLQKSCFASYLSQRPDYEALVAIPNQDNAWLLVTEDATRNGAYTEACKQRFANTGSTDFPTLLVKVELQNDTLMLTGLRPLQFALEYAVGNAPNDGIEGMTLTKDGRVLFALEKDTANQARVFEAAFTDDIFAHSDRFLAVQDSQLWLPDVGAGNHPVNGMDVYYPNDGDKGFVILAARNDDQLWIADLDKQYPTLIVDMLFNSPCDNNDPRPYKIKNAAIEGIAVEGNTLYLINDPWKKVYPSNTDTALCPADKAKYESMSPLLFQITLPSCLSTGAC